MGEYADDAIDQMIDSWGAHIPRLPRRPANVLTRLLRQRAHQSFDRIWR